MVIHLTSIAVRGSAQAGRFSGILELSAGLQVISAKNSYGKSLAVKALTWCLALEPIFGNTDNDPVRLPEAVRTELDLAGHSNTAVLSSECTVVFRDDAGRELHVTRSIKGGDPSTVAVREVAQDGTIRESRLLARRLTMSDEHGGFQHFLFSWLGWPRVEVATFKPGRSEVYLENLAPLFYVDQDEGWTNIQALQIGRYGQQQISEIAVEYLLGALPALVGRVSRLRATQRAAELRDSARLIADQVNDALVRRGWRIQWSGNGGIPDVLTRWSRRKLRQVLQEDASLDLEARFNAVKQRSEQLRTELTKGSIDVQNSSAPIAASQAVVELKGRRHALNQDLHTLRTQLEQASMLQESLEHRLLAATDLFRLKTTGVGRLDHLECPTCHRDIDPTTFGLTTQSADSVGAHIEALKRDREFMTKNIDSLASNVETTSAELLEIDTQLREAEKSLITVTSAVGTVREQIAATAADLTTAERELERVSDAIGELELLQASIDRWIGDAQTFEAAESAQINTERERSIFVEALREYLVALGHSAVNRQNATLVSLDEQYVPFMNGRRVRALGSASDQARLVAAYSLALAAASRRLQGNHPGFVVLDEPLQQNPDPRHRDLFLKFLTENLAQQSQFQTLIFTSLSDREIERLRRSGTATITPMGEHFLQLEQPPSAQSAPSPPPSQTVSPKQ